MGLPSYPIRVQVISHDPENDGVYVMTPSAQILPLVRRLYDHADGMRVKKGPLPVRGSWGLAWFPGGDIRNGFWMGAYHPNLVDALPGDASDPFSDYESNFDGSWAYRHGSSGYWANQWADNSSFVMTSGGLNIPQVSRHIVTSGQARQLIPYMQSDRNPQPQAPFGWKYTQSVSGNNGGLTASTDVSGNFALTSASGKTLNITFGSASIKIDQSGNVSINTGGTVTVVGPSGIYLN